MRVSATVIVTTLLDPSPISKKRRHQYKQNQYLNKPNSKQL